MDEPGAATPEKKASIRGFLLRLDSFETMFFLTVSIDIFGPCEQLAKSLQSSVLTASGALEGVRLLTKRLDDLRSEERFEDIYKDVENLADKLDLKYPSEPRKRKPPRRLEQIENPEPPVDLTMKTRLRKIFFEALDLLKNELESRFDQQSLKAVESLENVLFDACEGKVPTIEDLRRALGKYDGDFDIDDLHTQLKMMKNLPGIRLKSCIELADLFRSVSAVTKNIFNEVTKLLTLLLTVPVSAATSERSFSALRRLKTYLRSTMTQKRLNHVTLLHIHKEETADIDLHEVMREFVLRKDRLVVFGKI